MDDASQLQKQWSKRYYFLSQERFLDDQFSQLRKLQDDNDQTFLVNVVSQYFRDSEQTINDIDGLIDRSNIDFKLMSTYVYQILGGSAWIGALKVQNTCIEFIDYCETKNVEGCIMCLQRVREERLTLKNNLDNLFLLEQQIVAAGGTISTDE